MTEQELKNLRHNSLDASIRSFVGLISLLQTSPTTEEIVARAQAFEDFIKNTAQ